MMTTIFPPSFKSQNDLINYIQVFVQTYNPNINLFKKYD